jgi:DNA topoisomerase-2
MRLFDAKDKLKKYESVPEIIDDYFLTRFELYEKRKANLIEKLKKELVFLSNKARYIQETLEGKIDLRKKSKQTVIELLHSKSFAPIDDEFKYLVRLPMDSVTNENVEKIFKEHKEKECELEITIATSPNQMWLHELNVLKEEYAKYLKDRKSFSDDSETPKEKEKKVVVKRKVVVKK